MTSRVRPVRGLLAGLCLLASLPASAADLVVYGAGSLRESIGEIAQEWAQRHGHRVRTEFGPSGRMRERIERGEPVDVFTSADIGHPARLVADGRARVMAMFARNSLCLLMPAAAAVAPDQVAERLQDPALRIGVSPPRIDPLGDYTELLFNRLDALRPGAGAAIRARTEIMDAPPGAPPPVSGDPTTDAMRGNRIGAAIVYCSGRARYARLLPDHQLTPLPPALETWPEYGLAVLGTQPEALALGLAILSPEGQRVMAQWGFTPVALPTPP